MRTDKPDLPYQDRRVRQALMMATDFAAWRDDFYEGEAEILAFPVTRESKSAYVPMEEMPESVQVLYRYDPKKAMELLAEAGYPGGFKARMIVYDGLGAVDMASIYKDMWAKAGIDLELLPKEPAVCNSIAWSRAHDDMMLAHVAGGTQYPGCLGGSYLSWFGVSHPKIQSALQEIKNHVIADMPEADRLYRELLPYMAEQAYYVATPTPRVSMVWWPWLKNSYGQSPSRFDTYCWIDQDLKQEMTGRR